MTVTTMLPELVLRSPEADWNRARWQKLPDDGNRTSDSELVSPTLPIRVPIAGYFAGAPDTTL